jgi:hypothetical protein
MTRRRSGRGRRGDVLRLLDVPRHVPGPAGPSGSPAPGPALPRDLPGAAGVRPTLWSRPRREDR